MCGEPEFMDRMLLKYHEAAREKGVRGLVVVLSGMHRERGASAGVHAGPNPSGLFRCTHTEGNRVKGTPACM